MIRTIYGANIRRGEVFPETEETTDVSGIVSEIIENVRKNGDAALKEYTKKFDKAELESLIVTQEEIEEAFREVEENYIRILKTARDNIENYHKRQIRSSYIISEE